MSYNGNCNQGRSCTCKPVCDQDCGEPTWFVVLVYLLTILGGMLTVWFAVYLIVRVWSLL